MNKATRRPRRPRRPRRCAGLQLTQAQRRQLRKNARDRLAAQRNTSYLKGVEGCTYRPLKVATNAAHSVATVGSTTWRDQDNASK